MTVAALDARRVERSPWFVSWFDSIHYHNLYAYRDDSEAAGFIDELIQYLGPVNGSSMLDVGCGAGRHSIYLASKGFRVTGIDLSAGSIIANTCLELCHGNRARTPPNAVRPGPQGALAVVVDDPSRQP